MHSITRARFARRVRTAALVAFAGSALGAQALAIGPNVNCSQMCPTIPNSTIREIFHISTSGKVAGTLQGSPEKIFVESASGQMATMHPTFNVALLEPRVLLESGEMLVEGCIPPASGNGVCPFWYARYSPEAGFTALNPASAGLTGNLLNEQHMNSSGEIAVASATFTSGGTVTDLFIQTRDSVWTKFPAIIPNSTVAYTAAEFIDFNDKRQTLFKGGWQQPTFRASPGESALVTLPANFNARDMNNSGDIIGSTTGGPFLYTDSGGLRLLDPARQFPNAIAQSITDSGVVVGTWSGGYFTFTPSGGMKSAGTISFVAGGMSTTFGQIVGCNSKGEFTALAQENYTPVPVIKIGTMPAQRVQDLVDPSRSRILVRHVTSINDAGQFAVTGNIPNAVGNPGLPIAMRVQVSFARSDFDRDGARTVDDVFGYLNAWFNLAPGTDVNGDGSRTIDDVFTFINSWFAGI
jgi:hypothetical protein